MSGSLKEPMRIPQVIIKVSIRIDLFAEIAEKFEFIRKKLGLRTNAETIRYLITHYYDEVSKGPLDR